MKDIERNTKLVGAGTGKMRSLGAYDLKERLDKIDRPEAALESSTALGKEVMNEFRAALEVKRSERVGDFTVDELLRECKRAREDATLEDEVSFISKYPQWAAMPVSIVAFKVGILVALIRESLVDVASAPFIVDPTPVPDIPDEERERILDEVMKMTLEMGGDTVIAQQQYAMQAAQSGMSPEEAQRQEDYPKLDPNVLIDKLKDAKIELTRKAREHAEEQALSIQRELYDRTVEGGYRNAIMEFADDFATYPFGCIHGPFPTVSEETVWKGGKLKTEKRVVWTFERVSPFDLFWTEDCSSAQDGSAVFVRKRVGYDYLYDCLELAKSDKNSGYDVGALEELVELSKDGKIPRDWTLYFTPNPERVAALGPWSRGQSVEILIRYGKFSGKDLVELGYKLDDDKLYETKIIMCGGQVIYCAVNNNPGRYKRPVFTASFERRNGSIVGIGLGQKLLSIHKAYRSVIRLAMYNIGLSSEPITEVEVNRILQYMPDDWIDDPQIYPGMVIPTDGDRMGNGSRAIKFTQVPSTTAQALQLAQFIFEQAHVISNIPAALHGQPVGSGANRTVRGLLTLQGNTLKPIQSALVNLDLGIIEPMVTLLYNLLTMYDEGFDYSGDCKIVAKGAASMVQREMDKQAAMENLQILGQLGGSVNPELMNRTIVKLLTTAGVLSPGENPFITPMQQQQAATVQGPQGAPQGQPVPPDQGAVPGAPPPPVDAERSGPAS